MTKTHSFRIDPEVIKQLKIKCAQLDITITEAITQMIKDFLKPTNKKEGVSNGPKQKTNN